MAINEKLRDELVQILLEEMPPTPVELVLATGEIFTSEALEIARIYDKATNGQRDAFKEIAKSFGASLSEDN